MNKLIKLWAHFYARLTVRIYQFSRLIIARNPNENLFV